MVRAHHAPLSVGGPAHRPLVCLYPQRRCCPFPADERLQCFFPIGFDAFGLPAENAAIKHGAHPARWTFANIERMRGQLRRMGAMWAWEHEAVSCDPEYYKWSQWFFRKFYDAGLAYREYAPVDFCPTCNTTLAREQVWGDDRHCERCGTPVIKKDLEQWKFRITRYADELLDGLAQIEWPERVKTMQTHWIGRSSGAEVLFRTESGDVLEIFTTRPDTLWGATFMVVAPEHPLVASITSAAQQAAVVAYQEQAARMDEIQRGPPTRRRAASSPAAMRSTRSTANGFRSGSPTMS